MPETPDSVFLSNPELGPGGHYKPAVSGPWNMDPDHHRILYQSDHLVQKPWGLPSSSLQDVPQAGGGGDKDTDSQCSADLSNATDSGRGSNDGGSDGHHDYQPSSPGWHQDNRDGGEASPWPTPSKPRPPVRVSSINSSDLPPGVHRTPSNSTQHSDKSVSMAPDGRRHHNKYPLPPRQHKARHNLSRTGSREEHRAPPREDHVYYNASHPAGPTRSQGLWNLTDNGGGGGHKKKYASHV